MRRTKKTVLGVALLAVLTTLWSATLLAQEEIVCETEVTVQADDWLSKIAEKEYGDPLLYPALVTATNAAAATDSSYTAIADPNVIEVGWKLCVPSLAEAQALLGSDGASIPTAPTNASGSDPAALAPTELENATYSGIYEEPVSLTDGLYEGEPFVEGDSSRPTVRYIDNSALYGDLDGDGVEDAVVFLAESGGGTGNFVYVAAQLNQNGQPVDAGAVLLEDRIQVKSATIEAGQIKLEITAEGPGDAACCKSHKTQKTFTLQNGQLTEVSGEPESLERVSAADLNGTSWTLLELDTDQPVPAEPAIIINFTDTQFTGSSGCNSYNGDFSLSEENPFLMMVGPTITTRMACPPEIQSREEAYLAAWQNVTRWGYNVGKLAMSYNNDSEAGFGTLLFEPAGTETAATPEAPAENESTTGLADLTGSTWQWVGLTDPVQQVEIEQPENYTLTFQPDGTLQIKADCNNASAGYTAAEEGSLSVQPGITTLALCGPESRSEELVQKLGFAANYFFQDGHLFIDLMADGGTLEFSPR
ncbi:MAG TPA: META domain-containing protein [Anaerolineae bacterium]|nr:META domain-containing protein [Anaerolineae bacterium]